MALAKLDGAAPITDRRQLIEYFVAGCKAKADWQIGTEHEKFSFRRSTLSPVKYDDPKGLRDLLHVLKVYGWQDIKEGDIMVGLQRGGNRITLEAGGQIGLSGIRVKNLHEAAAEIDRHFEELNEVSSILDLSFMGLGFHPVAQRDAISCLPVPHHRISCDYLSKQGMLGCDALLRTCGARVDLDYADEADCVKKMRVATALQPIATALFAASPFTEGKSNGYQSYRAAVWQQTDPARCGLLPFVFEDGFGFERYVDYALDVPMIYIQRGETIIDAAGQSFRDFLAGHLPALPNEQPVMNDWHTHLACIFPDVRLMQDLELSGADCGNAEAILALPSFWTGILYDATACDAAWEIVKNWTQEERATLYRDVPCAGLKLPFRDRALSDLAHDCVRLAQQGLRRRAIRLHGGADETRYLDGLFMITESSTTYADDLLMRLEHQWHGDIKPVFADCRL